MSYEKKILKLQAEFKESAINADYYVYENLTKESPKLYKKFSLKRQKAWNAIKDLPDGRKAIFDLTADENDYVKASAASFSLKYNREDSLKVIRALAKKQGHLGTAMQYCLQRVTAEDFIPD